MRIINKTGVLNNPADRDHCLQYIVAVALLFGNLTAEHYEDSFAKDLRIDQLREKMQVHENGQFSKDYLDADKRSIANAIEIYFKDGSAPVKAQVEYPLGHLRRREECIPLLIKKFQDNLGHHFSAEKIEKLQELFSNQEQLERMPVHQFMTFLSG